VEKIGIGILKIQKHEFNHGGTRNLGAKLASESGADVLVFMTQDARPHD